MNMNCIEMHMLYQLLPKYRIRSGPLKDVIVVAVQFLYGVCQFVPLCSLCPGQGAGTRMANNVKFSNVDPDGLCRVVLTLHSSLALCLLT